MLPASCHSARYPWKPQSQVERDMRVQIMHCDDRKGMLLMSLFHSNDTRGQTLARGSMRSQPEEMHHVLGGGGCPLCDG